MSQRRVEGVAQQQRWSKRVKEGVVLVAVVVLTVVVVVVVVLVVQ